MSTLKELINTHSKVPGDIKVRCRDCPVNSYFVPYFVDAASEHCHGLNHDGEPDSFHAVYTDAWELYTKPKAKVKLYQYAYRSSYDGKWLTCLNYFKNDQAFFTEYSGGAKSCPRFLRLDYTMIEVDDE